MNALFFSTKTNSTYRVPIEREITLTYDNSVFTFKGSL